MPLNKKASRDQDVLDVIFELPASITKAIAKALTSEERTALRQSFEKAWHKGFTATNRHKLALLRSMEKATRKGNK